MFLEQKVYFGLAKVKEDTFFILLVKEFLLKTVNGEKKEIINLSLLEKN